MKLFPVVLGATVVGVGYLVYRNREAAKQTKPADQPSKEDAAAGLACKGLSSLLSSVGVPMTPEMCQKGLSGAGAVLDVIGGLNNKSDQQYAEEKRRDAINRKLNGDIAVGHPLMPPPNYRDIAAAPDPMKGGVIEFQNGCQPFFGAPGWSKCATGTQDMWRNSIYKAVGIGTSELNERAQGAYRTYDEYEAARKAKNVTRPMIKGALRTGSPGDPSMAGPRPNKDGTFRWWVRGKVVDCATGQCPKTVLQGAKIRDHRDNPSGTYAATTDERDDVTCVPVDSLGTPATPPPPGTSSSSSSQVACVGAQPPAGMTWDRAGYWRRLQAGETPNAGPCDPNAKQPTPITSPATTRLNDASTLAVVNGAFAGRQ
jgi:hypothetical protein